MMLTYPQSSLLHTRPTIVTTHGVLPQPLNQLPGFPVAIAPTLLQAHLPAHHHHAPTITSRSEASSPHGSDKTNCSSSPVSKATHSSFSIDSILGKKEEKTEHVSNERIPVAATAAQTAPARTNGLFYFYTPTQPASFPFATTPRPFDQDLQRSPLGSLVIPAAGKLQNPFDLLFDNLI